MLKLAVSICIVLGLGSGVAQAAESSCQATSSRMLDHLDKGDYTDATTDFNDRMKAALGTNQLAKLWTAVERKFGTRGAHEQGRPSRLNGHAVVITALHYGTHLIDARVVCDPDGKVAGFFIKPLD